MRPLLRLLAVLLLLTVPTRFAAAQADTGPIAAGTYALDSKHSKAEFKTTRLGLPFFTGLFPHIDGHVTYDPTDPARTQFVASAPAADVTSGDDEHDQRLRGPKWFDAARYPTIRFVSTAITSAGPESVRVTGDFFLHGVTRHVSVLAHVAETGHDDATGDDYMTFVANTSFERSAYNMVAMLPLIGDTIGLTLTLRFDRPVAKPAAQP